MKDNQSATVRQFIIYGAGKAGLSTYNLLKFAGIENVVYCFVDKNAETIKEINGVRVLTLEETLDLNLPYCICVNDPAAQHEIGEKLRQSGKEYGITGHDFIFEFIKDIGGDLVKFNRDFCAFSHIEGSYFDDAESQGWLQVFWVETSPFYQLFKNLDLSNVIELACGHGRHVPMYQKSAGEITLVDILDKNIDFCKERFKEMKNISYYRNSGFDLSKLPDNTYTSIFSYDAMVHFELLDIASYLKEFFRVLKPGGLVLAHHSNNTSDYRATFATAPGGRSYMSADIFAYLAYRNGFDVVEQKIIDWGVKDLDCISLLKKP